MHQNDKTLKQAIPKKDEKLNLKIQQRLKVFFTCQDYQTPKAETVTILLTLRTEEEKKW